MLLKISRGGAGNGEMQNKGGSFIFLAVYAYPAPVDPHYLQADVQSQTGGFLAVQAIPLDHRGVLEEGGDIFFGNSYSGVPYAQGDVPVVSISGAEMDLPSLGREFYGIAQ